MSVPIVFGVTRFGRLTVVRASSRTDSRGYKTFVTCKCDCGDERDYRRNNLQYGHTASCGACDVAVETPGTALMSVAGLLGSKSPAGDFETPMTEGEARSCVARVRANVDSIRKDVLDLHERKGWAALGYVSWGDCVEAEFGANRGHLYRQLSAAIIQAEVEPDLEIGAIPERQLRPLAKLPRGDRKEAWDEAKADGKVTGEKVAEVVDRKLGKAPAREKADGPLLSVKDGEPVADPPDVAKLRAAGKIGPDVIVEVSGDAPGPADAPASPSREPGEDEPETDEEWLETLPARTKLGENARLRFDRDALAYRSTEADRDRFALAVRSTLKAADRRGSLPSYLYRLRRFLKINDPAYWTVCPKPSDDGCGGTGMTKLGACKKCHGDGYLI